MWCRRNHANTNTDAECNADANGDADGHANAYKNGDADPDGYSLTECAGRHRGLRGTE
jgi:hypothetical protein